MAVEVDLIDDDRICVSLKRLLTLKEDARGFSFLPKHIATSRLAGRHGSKFRGRGINFEELRGYRVGDDVKNIDWKVTLKTGSPHIRAYSEEKDHSVILVVDQSQSMFFSSVCTMKSVVAAEVAALCLWRTLADNDRVGMITMGDKGHEWFSPKRGENNATRMLTSVVNSNTSLLSGDDGYSHLEDNKIQDSIKLLLSTGVTESVVVFVSDFYNLSQDTVNQLKHLQLKNDVLCIQVTDPLETKWDSGLDMVFSDGLHQINVSGEEDKISKFFSNDHANKRQSLSSVLSVKGLPLVELDTSGDHIKQLISQLSGVAS